MKTLKLQQHNLDLPATSRRKAGARPLPGEAPALPLCLIDTQTLRTLKVEVDAQQIAAAPPARAVPVGTPALSLATHETAEGYDPYNNFGEAVAKRQPRLSAQGSRH